MTVPALKRGLSAIAFHEGSQVWVPVLETVNSATADGASRRRVAHWRRAVVQVRRRGGAALRCCFVGLYVCFD
jgi:hypothetical protein